MFNFEKSPIWRDLPGWGTLKINALKTGQLSRKVHFIRAIIMQTWGALPGNDPPQNGPKK